MDSRNDEFDIHNLPSELRDVISSNVPISQIPKVCRSSKSIRERCKTGNFWAYYLSSNNIAESQQNLHELLVELAKQGDIELFAYIWNTDIIINRFKLIKEHRSLWEGFVMALTYRKKKTMEFIQELDYEWINKRAAKEVGLRVGKKINYIERFILKEKLIDLIVNKNFDELIKTYKIIPRFIFSLENYADILSHSTSFQVLEKAARIFHHRLEEHTIAFEHLLKAIARNNNVALFDELEDIYGNSINDFRVYFLESDSLVGDRLALKYKSYDSINTADYDIINRFGNGELAYNFVKNYPELTNSVLFTSFDCIPDNDIVLLLKDKCVNKKKKEIWKKLANKIGRDYLVYLIDNVIATCNND